MRVCTGNVDRDTPIQIDPRSTYYNSVYTVACSLDAPHSAEIRAALESRAPAASVPRSFRCCRSRTRPAPLPLRCPAVSPGNGPGQERRHPRAPAPRRVAFGTNSFDAKIPAALRQASQQQRRRGMGPACPGAAMGKAGRKGRRANHRSVVSARCELLLRTILLPGKGELSDCYGLDASPSTLSSCARSHDRPVTYYVLLTRAGLSLSSARRQFSDASHMRP